MKDELYDVALSEISDLSKIWNPFLIIDMRGLDGLGVMGPMLSRVSSLGLWLLLFFFLLRSIHLLANAISGKQGDGLLRFGAEVAILAGLLGGYDGIFRVLPELFGALGNSLMGSSAETLGGQVAGAFSEIANEKSSDFLFWSAKVFSLPLMSLLAALASSMALVLLFVIAKLQGFLMAFFYLLGPVLLPTLLFPPMRSVAWRYVSTYLGISFMGAVGPLFMVILVRAGWIPYAFSAGYAKDALTSLVFSLLTLILVVSVPVLSMQIMGGIESRLFLAGRGAMDLMGKTSRGLHTAYANSKAAVMGFSAKRKTQG